METKSILVEKLMKALSIIEYKEFSKLLVKEEKLLWIAENYNLARLEFEYINKYLGIILKEKTINL